MTMRDDPGFENVRFRDGAIAFMFLAALWFYEVYGHWLWSYKIPESIQVASMVALVSVLINNSVIKAVSHIDYLSRQR